MLTDALRVLLYYVLLRSSSTISLDYGITIRCTQTRECALPRKHSRRDAHRPGDPDLLHGRGEAVREPGEPGLRTVRLACISRCSW